MTSQTRSLAVKRSTDSGCSGLTGVRAAGANRRSRFGCTVYDGMIVVRISHGIFQSSRKERSHHKVAWSV